MVFCITVTVPFDNLSEEQIYSFLVSTTLAVLTIFFIVLVAAAAITTAAPIVLLPVPLAFSKPEFFADIPVLLFILPTASISRSRRYSPRRIGKRWGRGDDAPRSVDRSLHNIPVEIRARSMLRACTDRIPIGSLGWCRNCSNKNRKYRTNRLTYVASNRLSALQRIGLPPLVVAE